VTTSLRPSATELRRGKKTHVTTPPTVEVHTHNGVPRSTWFRAMPRISTWHRPYALLLMVLDCGATALASLIAVSTFEQATSGFNHDSPQLFNVVAYIGLPIGWLVILWGHGAYDRRYLGVGADEYKRVFRASITAAATVSFLSFAFVLALSRLSVGTALVGSLVFILIGRYLARRLLVLLRSHNRAVHRVLLIGTFNESNDVYSVMTRVPAAGLVPVGIHLTEGY